MTKLRNLMELGSVTVAITLDELRQAFLEWAQTEVRPITQETNGLKELYTRDEAAKLLGVNSSTLWRWNKTNYLPVTKVGGKVLYRRDDIERITSK